MSFVRCYRCGQKVHDPDIIRRDVKTHGGIRRVNACQACSALYDEEEWRQLIVGAIVGLVVIVVVGAFLVGLWWFLKRPPAG